MTKVEEFFNKYEYLADYYAKKIWDSNKIGMDIDDIRQELKIKLFLSIKAYAKKWKLYKDTGKQKPIPMEFYLKTVMINQVKDFIRDINKHDISSIEDVGELHIQISETNIEVLKTGVKIDTQDLTEIFSDPKQKRFMKLYFLYNMEIKELFKFSKAKTKKDKEKEVKDSVKSGLDKIREYLEP